MYRLAAVVLRSVSSSGYNTDGSAHLEDKCCLPFLGSLLLSPGRSFSARQQQQQQPAREFISIRALPHPHGPNCSTCLISAQVNEREHRWPKQEQQRTRFSLFLWSLSSSVSLPLPLAVGRPRNEFWPPIARVLIFSSLTSQS